MGEAHDPDCGLVAYHNAMAAHGVHLRRLADWPSLQGQVQHGPLVPGDDNLQEVVLRAPGYESLAEVLLRAFVQASAGKGKERHAGAGVPFERQPMATINQEQGSIDGYLYQARKKAIEAKRLPQGRAQAELLGAIVYLAGAVIALDTWAEHTLPKPEGGA